LYNSVEGMSRDLTVLVGYLTHNHPIVLTPF
jgi:hypothetical protein